MPEEYIELESGIQIPARSAGEIILAYQKGDYLGAMEQLQSISRLLEDSIDRFLVGAPGTAQIGVEGINKGRILQQIRRLRHQNPLAKHACKLVSRYTFGAGISWRAADEENVKPLIEEFWDDQDNQLELTSHQAMVQRCDELWTDGELFFAMFVDPEGGRIKVRTLPPEEIVDVITDPDDNRKPMYYRRQRQPRRFNFASGTWETLPARGRVSTVGTYVPSWLNNNVERDKSAEGPFGKRTTQGLLDDSMRIFHVAINKVGQFGLSELWSVRDWIRQFHQFMEDRITINRAAAAIAWQRKVKGGKQDISAAVSKGIAGKSVNVGETSVQIPPVAGSILTTPESVAYQWMRGDTGASQAVEDARMILMTLGAGISLPVHWLGEGGDANLATARAMNFPVFRMFLEWQQLWKSVFEFFFNHRLRMALETGKLTGGVEEIKGMDGSILEKRYDFGELTTFIDIDFPPLVQEDMKSVIDSVIALLGQFAGSSEARKDLAGIALTALGMNNVDEMLEAWFPKEGAEQSIATASEGMQKTIAALREASSAISGDGHKA